MTEELIKEDLSICYLKTIAAINGIAFESFHHDEDSADGMLHKMIELAPNYIANSSIIVQLKATSSSSSYRINEKEISYVLKAKNYNDLCMEAISPSILALLILPEDSTEWVHWSKDELMIKGKMFWASFQGNQKTKNTNTITVKIPIEHILTVETINDLMIMAAREEL